MDKYEEIISFEDSETSDLDDEVIEQLFEMKEKYQNDPESWL
jgi:hypothetical protein